MNDTETTTAPDLTSQIALLRRKLLPQDKDALKVAVLTEELKVRWQQQNVWDGQVDRWMAAYAIAIVVGISWLLGSERVSTLSQFFSDRNYDNSYFILALAIINATYILYISFKGYQIQQCRLYMHEIICKQLNDLTGGEANTFELWHRIDGKTEWRRVFYYLIVSSPPFGVSAYILWSYYHYAGRSLPRNDPHNLFFGFVVLMQLVAFLFSVSTAAHNRKWKRLCDEEKKKKSTDDSKHDGGELYREPPSVHVRRNVDTVASKPSNAESLGGHKASTPTGTLGGLRIIVSMICVACAIAASMRNSSSNDRK